MKDINKDCTIYILRKLSGVNLSARSYYLVLLFIFSNYRFSVKFLRFIGSLIDRLGANDNHLPLARAAMSTKKGFCNG